MRRALVTGAGGFIGQHIVRAALAEGFAVRATGSDDASLAPARALGAETVTADLRLGGRAAMEPLFAGIDTVLHAAGRFDFTLSALDLRGANQVATERVIEAALEARVSSFVYLSSAGVYGLPVETPIAEGGEKRPRNAYELSMWEGERAVLRAWRERGLPARVLRPSLVFGPGGRYGIAVLLAGLSLARAYRAREVLFIEGAPRMHHVQVVDVARAALFLASRDDTIGRAFNCAGDPPLAWSDLGARLCESFGLGRRRVPARLVKVLASLPKPVTVRANVRIARRWERLREREGLVAALRPLFDRSLLGYLAGDHVYDTRALAALGFRYHHPRLLDELDGLLEWYRAERWLPPPPPPPQSVRRG